jgi:type III restriction enzyme
MVETKKEGDIETSEVKEKTKAALEYCRHATDYTTKHNGKPWKYVLIPHGAVQVNMSFKYLVDQFQKRAT